MKGNCNDYRLLLPPYTNPCSAVCMDFLGQAGKGCFLTELFSKSKGRYEVGFPLY